MNLAWQIEIIDGLIKEDPESTIKDYLLRLSKPETINLKETEDMNTPKLYTTADAEFIVRHHRDYPAWMIADKLKLNESVVRNFGSRHNLEFAKGERRKVVVIPPAEEKLVADFSRPPAQYSNTGFISVTQKYAS